MSGYVTFNKYLYRLVKRCQLNSEPVLTSTNLTQANWICLRKLFFLSIAFASVFLLFNCYVSCVQAPPQCGGDNNKHENHALQIKVLPFSINVCLPEFGVVRINKLRCLMSLHIMSNNMWKG